MSGARRLTSQMTYDLIRNHLRRQALAFARQESLSRACCECQRRLDENDGHLFCEKHGIRKSWLVVDAHGRDVWGRRWSYKVG